jgi:hypothetical protein
VTCNWLPGPITLSPPLAQLDGGARAMYFVRRSTLPRRLR